MDVLIVDDHPLVLSGCRALLTSESHIQILSACDEVTGYAKFQDKRPTICVIDINLPELSGFELLRKIREDDPSAKVIMFSMNDNPAFVVRSIRMGASGYLSKSDDPRCLLEAIQLVADGGNYISPRLAKDVTFASASSKSGMDELSSREIEILRLIAQGKNIAEIADKLNLVYKTIANATSVLKQKLDAKGHSDLIRKAIEFNLTT